MSVMVVARARDDLAFTECDASGFVWRSGLLRPGTAPGEVVVADYSILGRRELVDYSSTGVVGLLPPDPRLPAPAAAAAWRGLTHDRAHLNADALAHLQPWFDARGEVTVFIEQCLDRVGQHLQKSSSDYLAVLSEDGQLIPEALPLLRDYPTPQHLGSTGPIQLSHALRAGMPHGRRDVIDRLLRLRQETLETWTVTPEAELAGLLIPSFIEHYLLLVRQRADLDDYVYRFGSHSIARQDPRRLLHENVSLLSLSLPPPVLQPDAAEPEELLQRADAIWARRSTPERSPDSDYHEYQRIRAALDACSEPPSAAAVLKLETLGQLLALSSGDFLGAIRYRTACEELVSDVSTWLDLSSTLAERLRSDANLAMSITEVCAVDGVEGFPGLRSAVETGFVGDATPELLTEAGGLLSLILALSGEHEAYQTALEITRAMVDEHGGLGPSRAAADITQLFLEAITPDTSPERVMSLRASADEQSGRTVYRSFFNYIMMLASYVSKDSETGFLNHSEIIRDGTWERYDRRCFRLTRLSHAMLLASKGDFPTARRELAAVHAETHDTTVAAEQLICALISLRLDLAAGRHSEVLTQTTPDGPLGEGRLVGVHMRRYAPLSLILRGTALMREGSTELAVACFLRATKFSAATGEWLTTLGSETAEYREWLTSCDGNNLPAGLNRSTYDAILARPIFIEHTLPVLTPQQTRILVLLARGRSTQSIAAELHITTNTIKSHLRRLYQALNVRSREQAVTYAAAYGLLT